MNVHLPAAPSGPKNAQGTGEGPPGRHEKLDGDFAAALAETVGESGEDTVRDEPHVLKSDDAGALLRAVRRVGARAERGAHEPKNGETPMPIFDPANDAAVELRPKGGRRSDHKALAKGVAAKETHGAGEVPAAPAGPDPAPAVAAAREVLAVLAVDLTARPERAVAPELAVSVRKGGGPRGADLSMLRSERAEGAELGDEPAIEEAAVLPVRVVRQEKHFQAAGVEARRWQIAQDTFEGGRALPTSEVQKPAPGDALPRQRPIAPAALARAAETATPVVGPASPVVAIEVAPGAVGMQIADRVQAAMTAPADPAASSPPPAGPGFEPETRQTLGPALRVIKLHLNPVELGAVTIVLSGNDEGLHIELAAELADTVSKVENDRNVLAARLSGAGYNVTDINVARLAGQGMDGDAREQAARHGGQQEQLPGNGARDRGAQHAEQQAERHSGAASPRSEAGAGLSQGAAAAPTVAGVSYAGRFRPI